MSLPQRLEIRPSCTLALCLGFTHCAAAAAAWLTPLPAVLLAPLLASIGASLAWSLMGHAALRTESAIVAIEFGGAPRLWYRTRRGGWASGELLGSSFVSAYVTVLNIRSAGHGRIKHVVLLRDNVDANEFRRLRVRLRWPPEAAAGAPDASM